MSTITAINTPTIIPGEIADQTHKKLSRLGEFNLLLALNKLLKAYDSLQGAVATLNANFSANGVVDIINANKALLDADQAYMDQFSLTHRDDKDKNGNNIYGSEMMALENGYADDKAACQKKTDQATVVTTLLSDTVNTMSKSTSAIGSQTQSALDLTSRLLEIVQSLVA